MAVAQVSEGDFEAVVLASDVPVLVEFGATWCAPCKAVAPELEALQAELGTRAKVVSVDIDQSPTLTRQLGVQSVPTFVVFAQGRPVGGNAGAMKKAQLLELLEPVLPRAAGALKPAEVAQLRAQQRICLVDVREAAVYGRAHIEGAINVPHTELPSRAVELMQLPLPPVLYCRAGDVAKALAGELAESGTPVAFLDGGVLGWEGEGFELYRPD